MDRKINIDLIIWLVFLLLLFGGSLIRWLLHRFGRKTGEETASPERPPTFMEEFKKILEGMVEERPEIVILEERPHKKRPRPDRVRTTKGVPHVAISKKEEKPTVPEGLVLGKEARPIAAEVYASKSFWQLLPKDELQKAVVLSEVLGIPRARRRRYRLF